IFWPAGSTRTLRAALKPTGPNRSSTRPPLLKVGSRLPAAVRRTTEAALGLEAIPPRTILPSRASAAAPAGSEEDRRGGGRGGRLAAKVGSRAPAASRQRPSRASRVGGTDRRLGENDGMGGFSLG